MKKIAIHSVPRSGSSWVGQIINSSPEVNYKFQPLFSYAFKGYLNENSSLSDIEFFFESIANSQDKFLLQQDKVEKGLYPRFFKGDRCTHIAYKEVRCHYILENLLKQSPEVYVIGIVRNPFAVIHSFINSPREFRADLGWKVDQEWRYAKEKNQGRKEEFYGYEKWKETAKLLLKLQQENPKRVFILSYDHLLDNLYEEVEKLFSFCGLEVGPQTLEFLSRSRSQQQDDVYSVFKDKKKDDDWRNGLDHKIIDAIAEDLQSDKKFYSDIQKLLQI